MDCAENRGLSIPSSRPVRVSVVVPCRNEIRYIREFLGTVLRQELGHLDMEVLIVDGMSDDGTRETLREFQERFAFIRMMDNPEQIVSTAMNRAIREAKGEIIVRMDAHTLYAPDYVRSCVEVLSETGAANVGGPALTRADGYVAEAIAHAFHTRFATGGAKYRDPQYEGPTDTVPYGCWRKSSLESIGLFDESLARGEDDDLNRRLAAAGGSVWQSPRITSWYRPRFRLSRLCWQHFQYGFWKVPIVLRHGAHPTARNFVPALCLLAGTILLLCAATVGASGLAASRNPFLIAWLALVSVYLGTSFVAALSVATRNGWRFLPVLPIVFAAFQFPYALGFLLGLVFPDSASQHPNSIRRAVSTITR